MSGAQNEPAMSFYGVYDGHAGKDAAAFAASHLHGYILNSPYFPSDPVLAIKDAFHKTDNIFLEKGQKEVRKYWMLEILGKDQQRSRFKRSQWICIGVKESWESKRSKRQSSF